MNKIHIRIILKSGIDFTVHCDKFVLERNGLDMPTGYKIEGITENKPIYINFEEVAAIIRVISNERE